MVNILETRYKNDLIKQVQETGNYTIWNAVVDYDISKTSLHILNLIIFSK